MVSNVELLSQLRANRREVECNRQVIPYLGCDKRRGGTPNLIGLDTERILVKRCLHKQGAKTSAAGRARAHTSNGPNEVGVVSHVHKQLQHKILLDSSPLARQLPGTLYTAASLQNAPMLCILKGNSCFSSWL